jgi:hypothetical protein
MSPISELGDLFDSGSQFRTTSIIFDVFITRSVSFVFEYVDL